MTAHNHTQSCDCRASHGMPGDQGRPGMTLWSVKAKAVLPCLAQTKPQHNTGHEMSVLLEETLRLPYPEIFELTEPATAQFEVRSQLVARTLC